MRELTLGRLDARGPRPPEPHQICQALQVGDRCRRNKPALLTAITDGRTNTRFSISLP